MGFGRIATPLGVVCPRVAGWIALLLLLVGCQSNIPDQGYRLTAHAALIDFSGLAATADIADIDVRGSVPDGWDCPPTQSNALFTHRQWRSPSRTVGVGIVHVNMPLPLSPKTLIWFAKSKYGKDAEKAGGHLIGEWTDALGREWFDAESAKYHVRGYAVTDGFDAWVVYTGFRRLGTPHPSEIGLAVRCMESIVPTPMTDQ